MNLATGALSMYWSSYEFLKLIARPIHIGCKSTNFIIIMFWIQYYPLLCFENLPSYSFTQSSELELIMYWTVLARLKIGQPIFFLLYGFSIIDILRRNSSVISSIIRAEFVTSKN